MKFILGQKKNMTQIFLEDGRRISVTVVEAKPNTVTQLKTQKKDGYVAVQVGSGVTKKSHAKPQLGHLKDIQSSRWMREVRLENVNDDQLAKYERGKSFGVSIFCPGDNVKATGISKGKGFQGVVKRHGFKGAPASHGTKDQVRMPGSIGSTGPARVFKGVRMGGRMGSDRVTVNGLQVVKVDVENNLLYIKGGLPGAFNSLVVIQGSGVFKGQKKSKQSVDSDLKGKEVGESGINTFVVDEGVQQDNENKDKKIEEKKDGKPEVTEGQESVTEEVKKDN